jgi:hypothetical protein
MVMEKTWKREQPIYFGVVVMLLRRRNDGK